MNRYPALHAARSEHRFRRIAATGLPVLAVLSWMVIGLARPQVPPAPFSVPGTAPPLEIAQSATRDPWSAAPSPRGTPNARAAGRPSGPRWTPDATARPVPPPAQTPPQAASSDSGENPRPSPSAKPRPETPVPTEAGPAAAPSSPPSTGPASVGGAAASHAGSAPEPAAPRTPSAPSPSERRIDAASPPEQAPVAEEPEPTAGCGGLLRPLLGCPGGPLGGLLSLLP